MSDKRDDDVEITADFDQTNGLADGLQGDSDGTAEGEERSEADRDADPSGLASADSSETDD